MNVRVSDSVEGCEVPRVEQVKVWTAMYWHYDSGDMIRMCASVAAVCMVTRLLVVRDSNKKSIVAVT
jgi:hypothetical protein